jgi:DNA-binding HxlR family transcriptional regulator/putative sterol carrier protein
VTRYEQFCAIARAAEVVGERWTLLIIRELLLGPKRYSDLKDRLSPVAPGVLNGRLRSLENRGLVQRVEVGPPTPARLFELTESGRALEPAMYELLRWGARYLFPQREGERFEADWLRMVLLAYAKSGPAPAVSIALRLTGDASETSLRVEGGSKGVEVAADGSPADATITADVGALMGLMSGRLTLDEALAAGRAKVDGSAAAAARVSDLFQT